MSEPLTKTWTCPKCNGHLSWCGEDEDAFCVLVLAHKHLCKETAVEITPAAVLPLPEEVEDFPSL